MTCKDFIEFLDRYLNGALTPTEREEFSRHLVICRDCDHYLANYRATIRLAAEAFADPDAEFPPGVPEDLVRAVTAACRAETPEQSHEIE